MNIIPSHFLYSLACCLLSSNIHIKSTFAFSIRPSSTSTSTTHNPTRQIMSSLSSSSSSGAEPSAPFARLNGLSSPEVLTHDTFLLDMWGVMHDGHQPYHGVLKTVRELKRRGKALIVLSNSSKRREDSEKMLTKLGFDPRDFENIITSGDVSHALLRNDAHSLGCSNWETLDDLIKNDRRNVFVFGSGDDDESYCTSAGWTPTSVEEADLIVARGTFTIDDGATVVSKRVDSDEYWRVMERSMTIAARKKMPMLVTNPDKVRPDASRNPMPGSIGDVYERFLWTSHCPPGGEMSEEEARTYVKRIGKPFREVYDIALKDGVSSRAIMVGDALETDVTGGSAMGCSTLWVIKDGIHNLDVEEKGMQRVVDGFNSNSHATYAYGKKIIPDYVVDHFQW